MTLSIAALFFAQANIPNVGTPSNFPPTAVGEGADEMWKAQAVPTPLSDDEACTMFNRISEDMSRETPIQLNEKTFMLKSAVECSAKVYFVIEEVQVSPREFELNWRKRLKEEWNREVCSNILYLPLIWNGWHLQRREALIGGEKIVIDATCN